MQSYQIQSTKNNPYPIFIGSQSIKFLAEQLGTLPKLQTIVILTDETVKALHLKSLQAQLDKLPYTVLVYTTASGECHKNLQTVQAIYDFLILHHVLRTDLLLAFGGGVIGDITGFVASTYMRGMDTIYLPTTFLSCVDSSIGGKTGVNANGQKNIIGTFHQPYCVICDTDFLSTLPPTYFLDGCMEVIKVALLGDSDFVQKLECGIIMQNLAYSIYHAILLKLSFVANDITDQKNRRFLNFGHTIGHALESSTHYSISHGKAVGIGMFHICTLGENLGITQKGLSQRVKKLLERYHLNLGEYNVSSDFYNAILLDKKRIGEEVPFIMLAKIGEPFLYPVKVRGLCDFLNPIIR